MKRGIVDIRSEEGSAAERSRRSAASNPRGFRPDVTVADTSKLEPGFAS